jgi:LAO/AO transport system kinase
MSDILNSAGSVHSLLQSIKQGDTRILSRCISWVENESGKYLDILQSLDLDQFSKNVIGITGPPGAGKSTLIDALAGNLLGQGGKKIAIICIDPSSPFHAGALLGDRIRMSKWFTHPDVYIRSLASRGNAGGLNPKVIEITDLLKAARFDYIIIETVGVGQNEVEVASIADSTVVVLTPESGDDIQAMKSGLMEIADIFVVNKSDHPEADNLLRHLENAVMYSKKEIPLVKTIASQGVGVETLSQIIVRDLNSNKDSEKRYRLIAEKTYQLVLQKKMRSIDKQALLDKIKEGIRIENFNMYRFVEDF